MSNEDSSRTPSPILPHVDISETAATNIAKATSISNSSFQLFLDPNWTHEEYTREMNPSSWKSKQPSGSRSQSIGATPSEAGPPHNAAEVDAVLADLFKKRDSIFKGTPLSPSAKGKAPITIDSDSSIGSLGDVYYDVEGKGDNEANSDDSDYSEPDFADGDMDEVARVVNVEDYEYVPEASPIPYEATPQPELEGTIYVGGPAPEDVEPGSKVKPGQPRVLACRDLSTSLTVKSLTEAIDTYRPEGKIILPKASMRCYRFDHEENGGRVPRMVLTVPMMKIGVTSPLHPFIYDVCNSYHLAPIQISSNGYRQMIALYILYHKLGYPEMDALIFGYFMQLKRCGAEHFGYVYFSVWPEFNKKELLTGSISNAGSWKEPFCYVHDVPRVKTSFNYLPIGPVRTVLKGEDKKRADNVLNISSREDRNIRALLSTENLIECGFLKEGVGLSPVPANARPSSRKRKEREEASSSHYELVDEDMSQGNSIVPPFMNKGNRKKLTTTTSKAQPVVKIAQDPPVRTNDAGQQLIESPVESPLKRSRKELQKDGPSQFVPKNLKEGTYAQHLFATLGTKFGGEKETAAWFNASATENADATTKCLAEAFIRQASHTQNYKALEKKVAILEYSKEQDKRSLEKTFKQDLQRETASLRTDLKNARKDKSDLEKQLAEAQDLAKKTAEKHEAELAKLKGEVDAAKLELKGAEEKFLAQGAVAFMKDFIRKIPDFDWDRLGEGNSAFAAGLAKEVEAEDAEEARLEAERLAEEARIAAEAEKANPDAPPPS